MPRWWFLHNLDGGTRENLHLDGGTERAQPLSTSFDSAIMVMRQPMMVRRCCQRSFPTLTDVTSVGRHNPRTWPYHPPKGKRPNQPPCMCRSLEPDAARVARPCSTGAVLAKPFSLCF